MTKIKAKPAHRYDPRPPIAGWARRHFNDYQPLPDFLNAIKVAMLARSAA
jgi:hypothetical protein